MVIFIVVLLFLGQETAGSISGVVVDEQGASLPAVSVTIRNKTTGRTLTLQTAYDGSYTASLLDPGSYSVEIKLTGFAAVMHPDIQVSAGKNLRVDATLKAGVGETLIVPQESVSRLDVRSFAVADEINASKIEMLPRGRSFQSLVGLAPSVNTGEIEGGIQISGASAAENDFIIDTIGTTSVIDGRSRQNATFDYLQEVQVKTAGIAAEYSGALGGVATAITRSGGDEYHGEGYYYFSGDSLTAAPARRLVLDPRDGRTVNLFQDQKDKDVLHEPGFSIGGPIRQGEMYFYTSMSRRWRDQGRMYGFNYGVEQGTMDRAHRAMNVFSKFSFLQSQTVQGNVTWLYTPERAAGTLPPFDGPGQNWLTSTRAANTANGDRGFFSPQSSYTASVNYTPATGVLINARGGFFWDNYKETGVPDISSVMYQTSSLGLSSVPQNLQGPAGTQNFPAVQHTRFDLGKRLNGHADVTYYGDARGSHELKAGYDVLFLMNDVDISYPGGGYILVHWNRSFTSPVTGNTDRGTYGYYEINQLGTASSLKGWNHAFYVQDAWRITPRLTVNAGARLEYETLPAFRPSQNQFVSGSSRVRFEWQDKAAPRFGAAFDLSGDGRAKLYGSWGRFFDWTRYSLIRGAFGGDTWRIRYRSLDTLNVFSLGGGNLPGRDLWNPAVANSFRDRLVPSFGPDTVDPALKPPSQDTLSLGVEYEWSRNQVFGVRYLHHNLRRAIDDLSVVVGGQEQFLFAANPGEGLARQVTNTTGLTAPFPFPKPVRRYDAVEFTFSRRTFTGWFGDLSYTWSRLYGNYAGVASSDEIRTPTTGVSHATTQQQGGSTSRPGSYAKNNWDLDEVMFDSRGNLDPQGLLATDRTHVFKFRGGYEFGWGTEVGGFVYAGSGTPLTTKVMTANSLPVFVNGRGDLGRTPVLAYADLAVAQNVRIDDARSVRFEFNILNAFNTRTARHRFEHWNRGAGIPVPTSAMDLSRVDLRGGYNARALIAASPDGQNAFDPRYGMDDLFNPGFSGRLAIKFIF